MRLFYLVTLFLLIFSSQTAVAVSTTSAFADCAITTMLRVGSKGAEVQCLQGKVGVIADGSFGPLTKIAVKAFQSSKGLVADGIVGRLTRAALNGAMASSANYPAGCASTMGYSVTTGAKCDGSLNLVPPNPPIDNSGSVAHSVKPEPISGKNNTSITNPNLANLDQFIATVVKVGRKNGKSEQELQIIAGSLKQTVINSDIEYNKKFRELLISESKLSANFETHSFLFVFDKIISKTFSFLGITPSIAHAVAGIPFGGALIFPFFCAENASWMITISPLPPTFVELLTYYPGTQGFASYNIPFTSWLLGTYVIPGICVIPAGPVPIIIPTEGTITPMVGSSPL